MTADTVGCSLLCVYCWNYTNNLSLKKGKFYSPEQVASKMLALGTKNHCHTFRLSGAEAILGENSFNHLLKVIGILVKEDSDARFIVETNGIMLGYDGTFAERLSGSVGDRIVVRISIKGTNEEHFQKLTGADGCGLNYQQMALCNLHSNGIDYNLAFIPNFFTTPDIESLGDLLEGAEVEQLRYYAGTKKRLQDAGLVD